MPLASGTCELCGDPFLKVNKLRRICLCCQIIRDVTFSPSRTKKCEFCKEIFFPVKNTYVICNDCREGGGDPDKYDACRLCSKHLRPAPGLERSCMSCVMRTQSRRSAYVMTLKRRREGLQKDRDRPVS